MCVCVCAVARFFVLLTGQVAVYILNQDRGEDEEKKELESIVQYRDGQLDRAKLGNFVTFIGTPLSVSVSL